MTPNDVAELGTIVGVWAHPDDEAYLSAGLMTTAIAAGNRVVCVTATRGERGTSDPQSWPPARLARLRERELAASLAALGVTEHRWLDYDDGRCDRVNDIVAVPSIEAILTDVDADTVVTFGPDGITGHPDHIAVGRWATEAADRIGVTTVLHATTTASWAERFAEVHRRFSVFGPDGPPETPEPELALALDLSSHLLDRKIAALRAQASQTAELREQMGESTYRRWWASECFVAPSRDGERLQRAASRG